MRNDVTDTIQEPPAADPIPAPPLLILGAGDEAACTDELCLPSDALATLEDPA